jgi:hypothetical protein
MSNAGQKYFPGSHPGFSHSWKFRPAEENANLKWAKNTSKIFDKFAVLRYPIAE